MVGTVCVKTQDTPTHWKTVSIHSDIRDKFQQTVAVTGWVQNTIGGIHMVSGSTHKGGDQPVPEYRTDWCTVWGKRTHDVTSADIWGLQRTEEWYVRRLSTPDKRALAHPPTYNESIRWKDFLVPCEIVSDLHAWNVNEMAFNLEPNLRGRAQSVLAD